MRTAALAIIIALGIPAPAYADHAGDGDCRGGYEECDRQSYDGQWSNEDRNRNRNRNRGSFSPGPFDRSPVDIRDNQFCVGPNSCPSGGKTPSDPQPQTCAGPFPWHCDPHPRGSS